MALRASSGVASVEAVLTVSEPWHPSFDADLNAPPDGVPAHPAVTTRPQVLPFGELAWETFERLSHCWQG
jgi:hypothetical protein